MTQRDPILGDQTVIRRPEARGSLQGGLDWLARRHVREMVKPIGSIGSRAPGAVTDRAERGRKLR